MLDDEHDVSFVEITFWSNRIDIRFYLSSYMMNKVKVLYGYDTILTYSSNTLTVRYIHRIRKQIPDAFFLFNNTDAVISYRQFLKIKNTFSFELSPSNASLFYKVDQISSLISKDKTAEEDFKNFVESHYHKKIKCVEDTLNELNEDTE